MNIVHVGKFYPPSRGGIETLVLNLAEGLRAAGDSVTVVCSAESGRGSEEWREGVRILRSGTPATLFSQPLSPTLVPHVLLHGRSADVVHVHTPNPLAELAGLLLPPSIPVVVSWHSDVVRQSGLKPLYGSLTRAFLRRVKRVIVATPHHVRYSDFLPEFAAKCSVVPYGIEDAAPPRPEDAQLRDALEKRFGRDYVLFVGRLVGYKGVDVLIRALRDLPRVTLVLAGDGPLRRDLEEEARRVGVHDRVHFTGSVDERTLAELYRACALFVLPSTTRAEAFGLVLLEAMARSRPVISTRLDSGVTLVNEHGVTGLVVEPNDSPALARAIGTLLAAPEERATMGERARARFVERFSRDALVQSMRALYADVLGQSRERDPDRKRERSTRHTA